MKFTILLFFATLTAPMSLAAQTTKKAAKKTPEQVGQSKPVDPSSEDALLKIADKIALKVAKIRGLELKHTVKKGIKDKAGLRSTLIKKVREELSDAQLEAESNVFKRLGLIPQDLDYKKMLIDVLTEQVAGFYDPDQKELYVMTGVPLELQKPAMAHELFHAIQDQHFNLTELQGPFTPTENADFSMARSALIEGDATVLMYDYSLNSPPGTSVAENPLVMKMLGGFGFEELAEMEKMIGTPEGATSLSDSALSSSPLVFRESLIFPYFSGMQFVVALKSGRTWEEFNEVYKNPPVSTEQILHPDKYFSGDVPRLLAFDASLPGYEINFDSTWGEFQWSIYFRTHKLSKDVSAIAAAGWDGDRVIGMSDGKNTVVVAATLWDSEADASDFFEKLQQVYNSQSDLGLPQKESGKHGQSLCYLDTDGKRAYIEKWGDIVLLIHGVPSTIVDKVETNPALYTLRDQIWSTFKRVDFYTEYDKKSARNKKKKK